MHRGHSFAHYSLFKHHLDILLDYPPSPFFMIDDFGSALTNLNEPIWQLLCCVLARNQAHGGKKSHLNLQIILLVVYKTQREKGKESSWGCIILWKPHPHHCYCPPVCVSVCALSRLPLFKASLIIPLFLIFPSSPPAPPFSAWLPRRDVDLWHLFDWKRTMNISCWSQKHTLSGFCCTCRVHLGSERGLWRWQTKRKGVFDRKRNVKCNKSVCLLSELNRQLSACSVRKEERWKEEARDV